jgi:hypothetical protein
VIPEVVLFLLLALAGEAVLIWSGQLGRRRADEEAYWAARDSRPELYDWAKELDL